MSALTSKMSSRQILSPLTGLCLPEDEYMPTLASLIKSDCNIPRQYSSSLSSNTDPCIDVLCDESCSHKDCLLRVSSARYVHENIPQPVHSSIDFDNLQKACSIHRIGFPTRIPGTSIQLRRTDIS